MSGLLGLSPGEGLTGLLLAVTAGVALTSAGAWVGARYLVRNAALRHVLLLSALLSCLALPAVASVCAATGFVLVTIPAAGDDSATPDMTGLPAAPPAGATDPSALAASCAPPPAEACACSPAQPGTQATPGPTSAVAESAAFAQSAGAAVWAMSAWAAGALLMLGRLARSCVAVLRLRRSCRLVQDGRVHALLWEAAGRLGMRRIPSLLVSDRVVSPSALGFWRPAVLLPERLLGVVSEDGLRDVLTHEVAHLRRGDQRVVLLQGLVAAVYWPIPWVRSLNRELTRAGEELCDDAVLEGRDAVSYGETLLRVAELLTTSRPMAAAVGIVGGRGELEQRIAGLLDPRRETAKSPGRAAACAVACLFIAGSVVLSATRVAIPAEPSPQQAFGCEPPTAQVAVLCCPS